MKWSTQIKRSIIELCFPSAAKRWAPLPVQGLSLFVCNQGALTSRISGRGNRIGPVCMSALSRLNRLMYRLMCQEVLRGRLPGPYLAQVQRSRSKVKVTRWANGNFLAILLSDWYKWQDTKPWPTVWCQNIRWHHGVTLLRHMTSQNDVSWAKGL